MKIKKEYGNIEYVFGIYWNTYGGTNLLSLSKGNGGLTTCSLIGKNKDKVEIIEPTINWRAIYFHNTGYGIYHWALIEENLLDDIREYDEDAYNRFLEIIKSEGLVDPDFY